MIRINARKPVRSGRRIEIGGREWLAGLYLLASVGGIPMAAADPSGDASLEQIVVTGTRRVEGLRAEDSAAPVQVIDAASLSRTAQPDLLQALSQNVPALTIQSIGGDTQSLTVSASLRGLSPNNTLVLINGKRRHTTANLSIDSGNGPFQGGAAADLGFIPAAAIDHIEVLTDGAAAQYGTDAIAGVVNVILKRQDHGIDAGVSYGKYYAGDGQTPDVYGNIGFSPGPNSFVNLTAEARYHEHTDHSGADPRALDPATLVDNPTLKTVPGYPYLSRVWGDPVEHLDLVTVNGGHDFASGAKFYSFLTYGKKTAEAYEYYRLPSKLPAVWPNGFLPTEAIDERDSAATAGLQWDLVGWRSDLSTTYGRDYIQVYTRNSANLALYAATGATPVSAHDGNWTTTQWTSTWDFDRDFSVGLKNPLNVAFGLEYRQESYAIDQGDLASYYQGGISAYPGFSATDAGKHTRANKAFYTDLSLSPLQGLTLDAAGRVESYSDVGHATVGKLTGRFDFNPTIALRGTISNGFRAPTLAEEYYSSTNLTPTSAFVQLPPNSLGARLVGVDGLRPEKSTNFSAGLVLHPTEKLLATLDFYQIEIKGRITPSGSVYGSGIGGTSDAVEQAILANGNILPPGAVTGTGIQIFANGIDTRTRGAELVVSYPTLLANEAHLDWSLAGNYNSTAITHVVGSLPQLNGQSLYSVGALSDVSSASPKFRFVLSANYSMGRVSVLARESVYGSSSEYGLGDDGVFYKTSIPTLPTTDLMFDYRITPAVTFAVGANNVFDKRPGTYNPKQIQSYRDFATGTNSLGQVEHGDPTAVLVAPEFAPFGFNGGYYFVKLMVRY